MEFQELEKALSAYHKGKPIMTDFEYDLKYQKLKDQYPDHQFFQKIGPAGKRKLPMEMESLNKIRPQEFKNWASKFKVKWFSVTPKYDGISCLLHYKDSILIAAYTRGDGKNGTIIKNIEYIQGVPHHKENIFGLDKPFHINGDLFVKGEIILSKIMFSYYYDPSDNARSIASGIVRKGQAIEMRRLNFIAIDYSCSDPRINFNYDEARLYRLPQLKKLGFIVTSFPYRETIRAKLTKLENSDEFDYHKKYFHPVNHHFSIACDSEVSIHNIFKYYEDHCPYELDGVVVEVTNEKIRKKLGSKNGRPEYMVAIKPDHDKQKGAISEISEIEWKASRRGLYKPVAKINPIHLNGVVIENITLHNAKYVQDNRLGRGSVIDIIRSGDVIPYVRGVIKSTIAEIPDTCNNCNSKLQWNDTKTDICCINAECIARQFQQLVFFFKTIGVENVGEAIIEAICYKLNSYALFDLLKLGREKFKKTLLEIEGFQERRASQVTNDIFSKIEKGIDLKTMMIASGIFNDSLTGFGPARVSILVERFGDKILTGNISAKEINQLKNFGDRTSYIFEQNIKYFQAFSKRLGKYMPLIKPKEIKGKLTGKKFCFTGFRDEKIESKIKNHGGLIVDSITKDNANNTILLASDGSNSTKISKAKSFGVKIIYKSNLNDIWA